MGTPISWLSSPGVCPIKVEITFSNLYSEDMGCHQLSAFAFKKLVGALVLSTIATFCYNFHWDYIDFISFIVYDVVLNYWIIFSNASHILHQISLKQRLCISLIGVPCTYLHLDVCSIVNDVWLSRALPILVLSVLKFPPPPKSTSPIFKTLEPTTSSTFYSRPSAPVTNPPRYPKTADRLLGPHLDPAEIIWAWADFITCLPITCFILSDSACFIGVNFLIFNGLISVVEEIYLPKSRPLWLH